MSKVAKNTYRAVKTTVYLDGDAYDVLKAVAADRGLTTASVLRDAVAEYGRRHAPRRRPRSVGAGHSRRGDVAERAEELLAGMGRRR